MHCVHLFIRRKSVFSRTSADFNRRSTNFKQVVKMKQVKIIFIACELAAILGVILFALFADLDDWMMRTMLVLMSLYAVVMQREQQSIEWEDEE